MHARREYLIGKKKTYLKIQDRRMKSQMLDEICETTGLNRKYVVDQLSARVALSEKKSRQRKARSKTYGSDVVVPLKKIWNILDCPCGQRLAPVMGQTIEALECHKEIVLSFDMKEKLLTASPSTIDRLLKPWRASVRRTLHSTTKPGSFLKRQIPIQLSRWDEKRPGFSEIDLCAHNGGNPEGEFANTLVDTDLATGWTEQEAFLGKAQKRILTSLKNIDEARPFPRLGIDSDTGGEFINWLLYTFCQDHAIVFTRGRPGKKNDNPYVEQKNWTHVRKIVGYHRYDTPEQVNLLNDLYRHELRLYENFFQPVMKLVAKRREGGRQHRTYDRPQTPYQRVLASPYVSETKKQELRTLYVTLNPAALRRKIELKLQTLKRTIQRPSHRTR